MPPYGYLGELGSNPGAPRSFPSAAMPAYSHPGMIPQQHGYYAAAPQAGLHPPQAHTAPRGARGGHPKKTGGAGNDRKGRDAEGNPKRGAGAERAATGLCPYCECVSRPFFAVGKVCDV
jgi:hypothetical protein